MDICHRNLKLINCLKIWILLRFTKVKVIFFALSIRIDLCRLKQ